MFKMFENYNLNDSINNLNTNKSCSNNEFITYLNLQLNEMSKNKNKYNNNNNNNNNNTRDKLIKLHNIHKTLSFFNDKYVKSFLDKINKEKNNLIDKKIIFQNNFKLFKKLIFRQLDIFLNNYYNIIYEIIQVKWSFILKDKIILFNINDTLILGNDCFGKIHIPIKIPYTINLNNYYII